MSTARLDQASCFLFSTQLTVGTSTVYDLWFLLWPWNTIPRVVSVVPFGIPESGDVL